MAIRQLDWLPGTTRRSMLLDGLVIALVAILARGALQYLAPVFINKDSVSYFVPGWDLAHGVGFSPDYRRAPLYSWLIAAALAAFGDQLSSVSLVQHILGAGTVVAAYILGVLTFGRRVALISALIAAVSGPLLIYEQRIDAETLFGFLLTITALFWALGLRRSQHRWFFVGGLVLGLAALTRPAGQVLILALPVALLIQKRQIGGAIGPACAAVVGLLLSKLPWTLLLYLQTGLVSGGATLGEPLLSHLVFGQQWMASAYRGEQLASEFRADGWLYDPLTTAQIRFALPDERANLSSDELLNQGRRQSIRLLSQGQSPSATRERIERSLQISPAQIDAVFQNLALEMIRSQPLGFLASSLRGSALVMLGRVEHLEISWDARRSQAGRMMEDDWYEVRRIRDLVQPATPTQMSAYGFIDALTNLVQPSRYGGIMSMLALLSVFVCRGRMDWGIATLLWSSVVILTLTSTTFSWAAPRYRYPIDPLMYLLSVATGLTLVSWLSRAVRHFAPFAPWIASHEAVGRTLEPASKPGTSR